MHKLGVLPSVMDVFFSTVGYPSVIFLVLYGEVKVRSPSQTYAPFSTGVPANQDFPRDFLVCDSKRTLLVFTCSPQLSLSIWEKIRSVQASQAQGTHNNKPGGTQRRMDWGQTRKLVAPYQASMMVNCSARMDSVDN